MEILNNFWSILTIESVSMTKLITLPLLFVEVYLSLYIFSFVLKVDYSRKQTFIYVICISIIFLLSNSFIVAPFNLVINYVSIFLMTYYLFKLNIVKSVLAIISPLLMFGLINTLILNPYLKLCNISSDILQSVPIYKFFYLCLTYFFSWFIIFIFKHNKINFKLQTDIDKHTNKIILANLFLGILMLSLQAILTFYYINNIPIIISIFNFILLFLYFFISFYSLTKVIKLQTTTRDLENAESYNNTLTILYDNVRGFKHDFDNMINVIGGYIDRNDMDGLKQYYLGLKKDCVRVNNAHVLNPKLINNSGIYNLVISKHQKATESKVNVHFEIFFDFNDLKMPIYEFSKILGILLDNAIEAAKECEEKQVNLMFRSSQRNHVQIITVENTYKNKDIDTKKIFEKGVSGKENHSGIGLWEINQIIMKHNNIVLRTTKDNNLFKQQLEIYY